MNFPITKLFTGLVRPLDHTSDSGFKAIIESENQETFMEIVLKPSSSELEDWDFECIDGEDASHYYDQDLLEDIGEQIEAHLIKSSTNIPEED